MPKKRTPKAGDPVLLRWVDIAGGDHGKPHPPIFRQMGWFSGYREIDGREYLVIDRTECENDPDGDYSVGWDIYPKGCVVEIIPIALPE